MRGECVAAGRQLQLSVASLGARARQDRASSGVELTALQAQLREKLREAMQLQGRWDAEKLELNSRYSQSNHSPLHPFKVHPQVLSTTGTHPSLNSTHPSFNPGYSPIIQLRVLTHHSTLGTPPCIELRVG